MTVAPPPIPAVQPLIALTKAHVDAAVEMINTCKALPSDYSIELHDALKSEGFVEHYERVGHRNFNLRTYTFPAGWSVEMCRYDSVSAQFWLLDRQFRKRAIIRLANVGTARRVTTMLGLRFYNHRIYDCNAEGNILPRDRTTEAVRKGIWITRQGRAGRLIGYVDETACAVARNMEADAYLDRVYPKHRDITAYWNDK